MKGNTLDKKEIDGSGNCLYSEFEWLGISSGSNEALTLLWLSASSLPFSDRANWKVWRTRPIEMRAKKVKS